MLKEPSDLRTAHLLRWICLAAGLILLANPGCSSEYPFGTKVLQADADVGRPIYGISADASVGYWDTGTPGYDETDPVYLHISAQGCSATRSGDIRLTSFEGHPAGSKIEPQDDDSNQPLTPMAATIRYLNLHGSQAYDLEDPVYLHQGAWNCVDVQGAGSAMTYADHDPDPHLDKEASASDFAERLPYRDRGIFIAGARCISFTDGYKLLISDRFIDVAPKAAGMWRGLMVEVIHGLKADYYHALGTWFVKISPAKMNSEGSDKWAYDGGVAFSARELICTNDIRLSNSGGLAAGTKVVNFDPDQNKIVASQALVSFSAENTEAARIGYFDANGDGIYDYPDDVYLNFPGSDTSSVAVNNLRLSGPIP